MQLKYDSEFKNIIEDFNLITEINNMPNNIINFLNKINEELVIFDKPNNKLYCPKCIKELNNNTCLKCNKTYKYTDIEKYRINTNISFIKDTIHYIEYYIFDTKETNLILYVIENRIEFDNPNSFISKKFNKYNIKNIYEVKKDGLYDFELNKFISFNEYKKIMDYFSNDIEEYNYDDDVLNTFHDSITKSFLYLDNIDDLKKYSFYKYSYIWKLKDYFKTNTVSLKVLTYLPIFIKEFEYLIKMKLYNLSYNADSIEYKDNFYNTFKVDKKYYKFMKDNDISLEELYSLRVYPTYNKDIMNFVSNYMYPIEVLKEYIDVLKAKEYIESQKLDYEYMYEYADYITLCKELNMNLKDKNILLPKNLIESHNKLIKEFEISKDPNINKRIKKLSKKLEVNIYKDDKYIIFPANSIDSLIDESSQMSNCVKTYCKKYSNNECQIYFMRYINSIDKSLVTIEVKNKLIVQARMKFNKKITKEIQDILNIWEKKYIKL